MLEDTKPFLKELFLHTLLILYYCFADSRHLLSGIFYSNSL